MMVAAAKIRLCSVKLTVRQVMTQMVCVLHHYQLAEFQY